MLKVPLRFSKSSKAFYDFWESEGGSYMLKKLNQTPKIDEADNLANLLNETDNLADEVIQNHLNSTENFNQNLENLIHRILNLNENEISIEIIKMNEQLLQKPSWLNLDLLNLGCEVCNISGKSGLIVLRNFSLMTGYMSAAINKPLVFTGALKKGATKRIGETTEFWVAVTQKNNLKESRSGLYHCVRTRLIHAFSRYMILKQKKWDFSVHGMPLNNWDMLATYLGFSVVYLEGLRKLGFRFSNKEQNAVYHLWRYIGYLIGIEDNILPKNQQEAIKSLYLWSKTQPEADNDTISLANALHIEPILAKFPERKFEKKMIQQINLGFNYYFIGTKSCEILKLPKRRPINFIIYIVPLINKLDMMICKFIKNYKQYLVRKGLSEQIFIEKSYLKKI